MTARALTAFLTLGCLVGCGGGTDGANGSGEGATAAEGAAPVRSTELPPGAEAVSLLGRPLSAPPLSAEVLADRSENLVAAEAELTASPEDPDAQIWVGRRLAYLGRYRDAIAQYTQGLTDHPDDARFLRHRGHRYITVREFDRAIEDLGRAAEMIRGTEDEVEPDGLPNARGIPTSTLHFNIWYHLGLAHYLSGDFERALEAYRSCMEVSRNDDSRVATAHWMYMTLRRLGRTDDAADFIRGIGDDLDVIENQSYLDLVRLYRGETRADELLDPDGDALAGATIGYGVGNWAYYGGDQPRAHEVWAQVLAGGDQWAAFGFIAAEAEEARRR